MTPERPNSLRLQDFNYAEAGAYFVTVVTYRREAILGDVKDGQTSLSRFGNLVANIWRDFPIRYSYIVLDEYIVMPDHFHAVLWIKHNPINPTFVGAGSLLRSPENSDDETMTATSKPALSTSPKNVHGGSPRAGYKSTTNDTINGLHSQSANEPAPTSVHVLSEIIRNFKTVSAKRINLIRRLPGTPVWQRGFHDRIIRDEEELNAVRQYIQTNPSRWTNYHDS
jgi:putative transposase